MPETEIDLGYPTGEKDLTSVDPGNLAVSEVAEVVVESMTPDEIADYIYHNEC